MRIVVTGGGTGGHLFPGIALATAMQERLADCRVLFIGTRRQLDQQALAGYDFELAAIRCLGLKGMGTLHRLQSVMQLPLAVREARKILRRFKPDLVFGVGGYVTGPVLAAARLHGIPVCIHEQNSVPGLANRMLARIARRIFLSIPCSYPFPERKTVLAGNPVRREILAAAEKAKPAGEQQQTTLLVLGGSQGAHRVNTLVMEAMQQLGSRGDGQVYCIHQTGRADLDEVKSRYARMGIKAEVDAFFQDMAGLYRRADLVISRAGATTLAELAVMGLPALLIPYPYAADDHQKTNALYYQAGGGARMFLEHELSGEKLVREIMSLLHDPEEFHTMAEKMKNMGRPEATEIILAECLRLIEETRRHAAS